MEYLDYFEFIRENNEAGDNQILNEIPKIPREVYYQCLWTLRDMDRLRILEAIHNYGGRPDEMIVCEEDWCSMVDEDVMIEAERRLEAIRMAIALIPPDMRQPMLDNITAGTLYGDFAHENTWKRWKKRFMFNLARNLKLI